MTRRRTVVGLALLSAVVMVLQGAVTTVWAAGPRPAPPTTSTGQIGSIAVDPARVTGGADARGMVTLAAPAPTGGVVVTLKSGESQIVLVPASVQVPGGARSATFKIQTKKVAQESLVGIAAQLGSAPAMTVQLTVTPAASASGAPAAAGYDLKKNQRK
jgi:hypothetical protein